MAKGSKSTKAAVQARDDRQSSESGADNDHDHDHDDHDHDQDHDNNNDNDHEHENEQSNDGGAPVKRKRLTQACDPCRKKKIKCGMLALAKTGDGTRNGVLVMSCWLFIVSFSGTYCEQLTIWTYGPSRHSLLTFLSFSHFFLPFTRTFRSITPGSLCNMCWRKYYECADNAEMQTTRQHAPPNDKQRNACIV